MSKLLEIFESLQNQKSEDKSREELQIANRATTTARNYQEILVPNVDLRLTKLRSHFDRLITPILSELLQIPIVVQGAGIISKYEEVDMPGKWHSFGWGTIWPDEGKSELTRSQLLTKCKAEYLNKDIFTRLTNQQVNTEVLIKKSGSVIWARESGHNSGSQHIVTLALQERGGDTNLNLTLGEQTLPIKYSTTNNSWVDKTYELISKGILNNKTYTGYNHNEVLTGM